MNMCNTAACAVVAVHTGPEPLSGVYKNACNAVMLACYVRLLAITFCTEMSQDARSLTWHSSTLQSLPHASINFECA